MLSIELLQLSLQKVISFPFEFIVSMYSGCTVHHEIYAFWEVQAFVGE